MGYDDKRNATRKPTQRTVRSGGSHASASHAKGAESGRRGPQNASSVSFSNTHATKRATRGEVTTITPTSSSGEGVAAYRHSTRQDRYIQMIQRRARRKRILAFVVAALIVVGIAIVAGILAFRSTIGKDMVLTNSDANTVLVAPKDGEAVYTLVTAEIGAVAQPFARSGPDVILLVRTDEENGAVTFINIPPDLRVTSGNNEIHRLFEAATEGDAALISAVSKFSGVSINHLVKVNEQGLADMVEYLGGLEIDVDQVIDDPHAGSPYIAPGNQLLAGENLLTYLRATNVKLGSLDQMTHQLEAAKALVSKLFAEGGAIGFTKRLDDLGAYFQTDYSYDELRKLQSWLKDVSSDSYILVTTPGYTEATTGVVEGEVGYFIASSSEFATIIETLEDGGNPNTADDAQATLDRGSFTVAIQNGYNITGAASATADALRNAGFNVGDVGNAEQPVYEETLVIYKQDPQGTARAQAVINALGIGRAVYASYYYDFQGDILVIIGADYMPTT